jgi:hypothetical protein
MKLDKKGCVGPCCCSRRPDIRSIGVMTTGPALGAGKAHGHASSTVQWAGPKTIFIYLNTLIVGGGHRAHGFLEGAGAAFLGAGAALLVLLEEG